MTIKGGKRPGAGRKKGIPNKANAEREAAIRSSGLTPLDYMLQTLRDPESDKDSKRWAAQAAAPFCHPKLANIEANISATLNHEDTLDRVAKAKAAGLI